MKNPTSAARDRTWLLGLVLLTAATATAAPDTGIAEIGEPAPDFALRDQEEAFRDAVAEELF